MSKRFIPLPTQCQPKKPRIESKRKLSIPRNEPPKETQIEENLDHFFDEEDDDDLLFATQRIELNFSGITFSGFKHGVTASTQKSADGNVDISFCLLILFS